MSRMKRLARSPSMAALAALLMSGIANAQERDECFASCKAESGAAECRFDAHESSQFCAEDNGCQELRHAYTAACFVEDRVEAACDEARTLFRECVTPCREEFRERMEVCRDSMVSCVEELCGVELPEPEERRDCRDRFAPRAGTDHERTREETS